MGGFFMERIEYFAQEITERDQKLEVAKNVVSDHDLWVKTYEEIAQKAWRKLEKRVLDIV